jgi:MtaA/CmuA family methyltransferase
MNSLERCLAAIRGEVPDRVPVFPLLMFFAQQRAGITYREFATNGEALAEAQLKIRERFPVDALTVCSDAFRLTADLGADMSYPLDKPPFAKNHLVRNEADLYKLGRPDPTAAGSRMADRVLGTRMLAKAAGQECLVVGWVDMPFAEACSLLGVTEFMLLLVDEPVLAHRILEWLTVRVIDFARAQLQAGAPMIGAGDAAASLVSAEQYREFALPYEHQVAAAVHESGGLMKLHICGQTTHLLKDMVKSGADLSNVDHLVPFETACEVYGASRLCFKGNLDPVSEMMQSTPLACAARCRDLMGQAKGLRYMLSPGCEVPAATTDEVFEAFCRSPQVACVDGTLCNGIC